MPASYEFWLTDDNGKRLKMLEKIAWASYTRSTIGLANIDLGVPYELFSKEFNPFFRPDWRIEAWRSPDIGVPLRREEVYLLRKPHIYRRKDGMKILQFYGRNGRDLLRRRTIIQAPATSYTRKDDMAADDMMKEIVRQQMLYGSALDKDGVVDNDRAWPQNEFLVQADTSDGPLISMSFDGKTVLDALKDIKGATFQKNLEDSTNNRIFFAVEPFNTFGLSTDYNSPLGWEFRTYSGLYGADRTDGIEFSEENENITNPDYSINHLEEENTIYVTNGSGDAFPLTTMVQDAARAGASRWNRCEGMISSSSESIESNLQNAGYAELHKKRPMEEFPVTFLSTSGSRTVPRSLYGVDWDLGDLLPVSFAGKQFNVEVTVVYVSVNEDGQENVTGRNEVNAQ